MTTPNLKLPEILESQAGKAITHNEALAMIDVFVLGRLLSRLQTDPPVSPNEGDAYFVPEGATGDWAAQVGKVAHWYNSQWYFYTTPDTWKAYIVDETGTFQFNGVDWDKDPIIVSTTPIYDNWQDIPLDFRGYCRVKGNAPDLPVGLPNKAFECITYGAARNFLAFSQATVPSETFNIYRSPEGVYEVQGRLTDSQGKTYVDVGLGDATVSPFDSNVPVIQFGGTSATPVTITIDNILKSTFLYNDSDTTVTVTVGDAGDTVDLLPGARKLIAHGGSGLQELNGSPIGGGGGDTGKAYVDVTSGNQTLSSGQSNVPVIQVGGTPGTSRTVTLEALERMWVVTNDSDGGVSLTTGSGGTVFLEAGFQYVVFGDGVGVRAAITIAPNGLKMNGDLILPIYSTASLPDPSTRYMVTVGCTDGDSGSPCLAVSDGGSWKRVALGATVSAT